MLKGEGFMQSEEELEYSKPNVKKASIFFLQGWVENTGQQ